MKRIRLLFIFAALLLLAGAGAEYGVLAPRRAELAKLAAEATRLDAVLRRQREALAATQRERRDLEQSAESARAAAAAAEAASAMKLWGARIALLKRLLREMPAQALPELRLLEPNDWIAIVRKRELDTPETIRDAFAAARARGLAKMGKVLFDAAKAFAAQSNGEFPREIGLLAAHLAPPADLEMLQRYKVVRSGKLEAGDEPIIVEIAPRDFILKITPSGWHLRTNSDWKSHHDESDSVRIARAGDAINSALHSEGMPAESLPSITKVLVGFQEMVSELEPQMEKIFSGSVGDELKRAAKRYQAERGVPPATMADLARYVSKFEQLAPLARPLLARLEYMRDHEGQPPTDPAKLQRYLDRPFDQMNVLRAMKLVVDGDSM
ncbi:MAG TPA: hypothetical protein VGE76_20310, partial [Opitutaceae bacterium]